MVSRRRDAKLRGLGSRDDRRRAHLAHAPAARQRHRLGGNQGSGWSHHSRSASDGKGQRVALKRRDVERRRAHLDQARPSDGSDVSAVSRRLRWVRLGQRTRATIILHRGRRSYSGAVGVAWRSQSDQRATRRSARRIVLLSAWEHTRPPDQAVRWQLARGD